MTRRPHHVRLLALATLTSLVASGCLAADPPPQPEETPPADTGLPETKIPWGLNECRYVVGIVSAPAARLASHLPSGFRSISLAQHVNPGAPNPNNDGNLGVEAFICKDGLGLNETVADLHYGGYFTTVVPPAELRRTDVNFHFYKWDVLIPDAPRRDLLQAYGLPALNGSVTISRFTSQNGLYAIDASLTLNGTSVARIVGAEGFADAAGSFVEFAKTPNGYSTWHTKYTPPTIGTGRVTFAPGSFGARIVGSEEISGLSFGGVASFREGTITLPAQPAPAKA